MKRDGPASDQRTPYIDPICERATTLGQPAVSICERMPQVQALLDDHVAGGQDSAADVISKAQAILSEPALQRAMFDVGYFPPNTPPVD
jgi:hypothetical protein